MKTRLQQFFGISYIYIFRSNMILFISISKSVYNMCNSFESFIID